ncbi:RING finger protein 121 [Diabrotica virgifera virgifera]|uniref:RING finger protein 121 n=1 Tax=Diabrotica virgifera virgifera TaxID=50390 RepID=A0A6P7FLY5_DIAVI|nr:RING finger protein 121 [Diabrotica virgifera virgifera]
MDLHKVVELGNRTFEELSPEEKLRLEHQRIHEQHKGHEKMHAEMVIVLIITLVVAQLCLIEWKKRHYRSYSLVTLLAMWILPLGLCLRSHWWRFVFIWLLFSCITSLIVRKAIQKPIDRTTPRLVYKWFLLLHKLSYALGILGYFVMMATFFGLNFVFNAQPNSWMDCALLLIFYGLYYGVLGRDIAEICADKMAAHIGYYSPQGISTRNLDPSVCAVCGNKLLVSEDEEGVIENTYKLSCEHVFHEFCIRGWCIVGKKQTCPYCKEKVDLKKMFSNPWEKPHVLFGQLLDWIRWLVAWQPVIVFLVQGINWALGLE